jgi:hypothetical protein
MERVACLSQRILADLCTSILCYPASCTFVGVWVTCNPIDASRDSHRADMVDSIVQRAEGHLVLVAARELNPIGELVPEVDAQVFLSHAKCHV